ncbi:MAG: CCDC90 family protein [Magnetococcus sp. THC-1_WYH]
MAKPSRGNFICCLVVARGTLIPVVTLEGDFPISPAIAFDTLAYAKRLKAVGVPESQAEVHAEAMVELVEDRLATKLDIENVRRDMKEMEMRLVIRLGGMQAATVAIVAALVKLL